MDDDDSTWSSCSFHGCFYAKNLHWWTMKILSQKLVTCSSTMKLVTVLDILLHASLQFVKITCKIHGWMFLWLCYALTIRCHWNWGNNSSYLKVFGRGIRKFTCSLVLLPWVLFSSFADWILVCLLRFWFVCSFLVWYVRQLFARESLIRGSRIWSALLWR
jgi:hypothetical protein